MDKLYWLEQIQDSADRHNSVYSAYRAVLGEQVLNLAKLAQWGYPVTPGFVIGADLWWEFTEQLTNSATLVADLPHSSLQEASLRLSSLHLDGQNWRQLQLVANRLCDEVMNAKLPNDWIRSMGEAAQKLQSRCLQLRPILILPKQIQEPTSTIGLLSVDGCVCDSGTVNIATSITNALKRVWSQVFRAKNLLYWERLGIDLSQIGIGVLVQPLDQVVASGFLTVNPQMWEVQSTWGLGLAIERGDVIPDVDKIHPQQGRAIERKLGHKTVADWVLTDGEAQHRYQTRAITPLSEQAWMTTCILEDEQQQKFAVTTTDLERLVETAQQLRESITRELAPNQSQDFYQSFILDWTISTTTEGTKLAIANIRFPQVTHQVDGYHIQGLGAAGGRATGIAQVIANLQHKPNSLPPGSILVVPSIATEWLPLLTNSVGIITEQGGLTSHAAILARELGIPAIVRVVNATQKIQTGDNLLIDGDKGEVFSDRDTNLTHTHFDPEKETGISHSHTNPHGHFPVKSNPVMADRHTQGNNSVPVMGLNPIATQLFVNLSQTQSLESIQSYPVDGVGLLRSELMGIGLLEGKQLEEWLTNSRRRAKLLERWSECLSQFARAFAPRPVFYRTYDGRYHQDHPQLDRGTFNYIRKPELLEFELQAVAQAIAAGHSNLCLILPFVRTVEEFSFCRDRVVNAGLTQHPEFKLWIMAEVPSVLFLLPEYVKAGVQGIAIGTNDLTRLLFAVERDTSVTVPDARHPAVLAAVQQLILAAQTAGIPCSICGQAPSQHPEIIDNLVRWGITAISVEPNAIEKVYHAIARAEHRLILEAARSRDFGLRE